MNPVISAFVSEFAGAIAAAGSFAVLCVCAYVVFRLLKRSARVAVRLVVVLVIVAVAASGSLALYWFLKTPAKPVSKSRSTRTGR
ncbi:MAG: hypothetical protein UZ17_ACD001000356 [Acidobacteria bacterium OLB17]|nr:MAG: hypothetical protein UZ17_ACD001000356 [Acidobacteria bacterium OLB17]MCZ2390462.1 hypothetical protein [Acidobacteriota bacterium]